MASRRLAYSFNQALRSRAALRSIQALRCRGFATPIDTQLKTESTTLNNGLTVGIPAACQCFDLTNSLDRDRAFAMGSDVDCWSLD